MTIEEQVRKFILKKLKFEGKGELTDEYPLLRGEVIDSMSIFRVVGFLQDEMDIVVDPEELVPENFGTISAIARFVREKQGPVT